MRLSFLLFSLLATSIATSASVPVVSVPVNKTIPSVPASQKVETYVSALRKDMDAQEGVLKSYLSTAELERSNRQKRIKALSLVLNHLHEQLLNTTKYYHDYNAYVSDAEAKLKPISAEYDRALALYTTTKKKAEEERKFLDTLLAYIRSRASVRC